MDDMVVVSTKPKPKRRKRRRRRFGKIFKRPGGPGYLLQVPTGGKTKSGLPRYATRSFRTAAEAESALKEIEKQVILGTFAVPAAAEPPKCETTLLDAIDAYVETKRGEGRSERGITRYLSSRTVIDRSPIGGLRVCDLRPDDIERFMSWRRNHKFHTRRGKVTVKRGAKVSTSSVNRDLALVSAALNRLIRLGSLETNVAKAVKRGREPVRARSVLTRDEARRLLDAAEPHLRSLLIAGMCTGARPSELLALRWRDVQLDGEGTLTLFREKVGLGDTLPLHPRLAEEFRRIRAGRPRARDGDHILLSSRGTAQWRYYNTFKTALKRAGLAAKKITLYEATRHSFASHFVANGSASDLQLLLGHKSILTTQRYIRALNGRTRASLAAVDLVG